MRTTVTLDDDIAVAVEQLRRRNGFGISAAVNELARRGLAEPAQAPAPFRQTVSSLGRSRIPLDDISAALEVLEGETSRG